MGITPYEFFSPCEGGVPKGRGGKYINSPFRLRHLPFTGKEKSPKLLHTGSIFLPLSFLIYPLKQDY